MRNDVQVIQGTQRASLCQWFQQYTGQACGRSFPALVIGWANEIPQQFHAAAQALAAHITGNGQDAFAGQHENHHAVFANYVFNQAFAFFQVIADGLSIVVLLILSLFPILSLYLPALAGLYNP